MKADVLLAYCPPSLVDFTHIYVTRPLSFTRQVQLPFYIVPWGSVDVNNVLGTKWNFGPKA